MRVARRGLPAFLSTLKLVLLITKGIIRDQHTRRMAMFVMLIAALVMLFAGATFLDAILRHHLFWLVFYWGACLWFTVASALLAVFDMLMLRVRARAERRALRERVFGENARDEKAGKD
jgi:hypothetical protein